MTKSTDRRRIVSSRHLAQGEGWEISEFEYGLIIAYNAFNRWIQHCMAAAGMPELSSLEILVLHNTNHRNREKRLTDISFLLNIEDAHTINYALRKLKKLDLIISKKRGKEAYYCTTKTGRDLCDLYRKIREQCLLDGIPRTEITGDEFSSIATRLRAMSGHYDQAGRAATSL